MRKWLRRRFRRKVWRYVYQQLADMAEILDIDLGKLAKAAEWVLLHGRPPEEFPKD